MLYNNILNYEVVGEGIPILSIHGFGCDTRLMKGCMEPILQDTQKYKRYYIDIPGMGKSTDDLQYASSDAILDVLVEFIQEIIQEKTILVGESYGGYLCLGIMAKIPDLISKVALICPMVSAEKIQRNLPIKDYKEWDQDLLDTLTEEEKQDFLPFAVVANNYTYQRYLKEVKSGQLIRRDFFLEKLLKSYGFSFDIDMTLEEVSSIVNTTFICGKQDDIVGYQDQFMLSSTLKRSNYYLIDKAGHNLQIEAPYAFENIIKIFLNQ